MKLIDADNLLTAFPPEEDEILKIRASDAVTICRLMGVNQMAGAGRTVTTMADNELFGNSEQLEMVADTDA